MTFIHFPNVVIFASMFRSINSPVSHYKTFLKQKGWCSVDSCFRNSSERPIASSFLRTAIAFR